MALTFSYFFLTVTTFWILKPLKKTLFIQFYDQSGVDLATWHLSAPQAELIAKVANMAVAFIAVVVFQLACGPVPEAESHLHFSGFSRCDVAYTRLMDDATARWLLPGGESLPAR